MDTLDLEILANTTASRNKPPAYAIKLLEDTCSATGLDWKRRHLYLMERAGKWAVTLSIDGFRLVGSQDPDYVGQDGPMFVTSADGVWTDIPPDGPVYAAKVGIKHRNGTTTWGVARFRDYKTGQMWDKFPSTMTAKCAEMLAWRKAFPGRLGGLYGLEEMAQADKTAARLVEKETRSKNNYGPSDGDVTYETDIAAAVSSEALKDIGKRIAADDSLTADRKMDLHRQYQKAKADLASRAG